MTDEESDPPTPDDDDGAGDPPGDSAADATEPAPAETPPDDDDPPMDADADADAPTKDSSPTTDPATTDDADSADRESTQTASGTHDLWAPDEEYERGPADAAAGDADTAAGADATTGGEAGAGPADTTSSGGASTRDGATTHPDTAGAERDLAPAPEQLSAEDTYAFLRPARRNLAKYLDRTGLEVVETTWLRPPFSYGAILQEPDTGDHRYHVVEPELSAAEATLKDDLEDQLRDELLFRSPDTPGDSGAAGIDTVAGDQSALGGSGGAGQGAGAEAGPARAGDRGGGGGTGPGASGGGNPADSGATGNSDQARAATLRAAVERIVNKYDLAVEDESLRRVTYFLVRDWVHTGVIDPLLQDPRIEEVSCDGDDIPIFIYHRDYESLQTNRAFASGDLRPFVTKLAQRAGKDLSIANPLEGAALPDGSRIELTLGETTERGPTFTVRKFREDPYTMPNLIQLGTFDSQVLAYLWEAIINNLSILVVGGTASGKTTTLNAISLCIPPKTKIVSIEDTRELQLPHSNWVPHLTREGFTEGSGIGMQSLLRHALRQRPELIAVGEVRGAEAGVLFQSMNTGHQALSTVHADSVRGLISRLENPPMAVERELISELDVIVIQAQVTVDDERVRRCTEIAELYDLDPDTRDLETRTVYSWEESSDSIRHMADSRHLERLAERGREPFQSIEHRAEVLDYLAAHDITDHDEVADVVQTYHLAPDRVRTQVADDALDLEALRAIRERALSADIQTPSESDLRGAGAEAEATTDTDSK